MVKLWNTAGNQDAKSDYKLIFYFLVVNFLAKIIPAHSILKIACSEVPRQGKYLNSKAILQVIDFSPFAKLFLMILKVRSRVEICWRNKTHISENSELNYREKSFVNVV